MVNSISISDPYMYYKLDPGEVGPTLPVKARESIMHVASHEAANLARMKYDAWSKGGIVVYEHLHLNYTRRGSFIAASSGYSEVKVIYPSRRGTPPPIYPDHYGIIDSQDDNKDTSFFDGSLKEKDFSKYIDDLKIDKEISETEKEIDRVLTKADSSIQDQRIKEAIRAYKTIISLAKNLKKNEKEKELAKTLVSSIKNRIRNNINLLT